LKTIDATIGDIVVTDTTVSDNTGLVEVIPEDPVIPIIDTIIPPAMPVERIIIGDSIYDELPVKKPKTDSACSIPKIKKTLRPGDIVEVPVILMGVPMLSRPGPVKAKNPPKADSIDCKTIKNYY
jgi:hypothetical protein